MDFYTPSTSLENTGDPFSVTTKHGYTTYKRGHVLTLAGSNNKSSTGGPALSTIDAHLCPAGLKKRKKPKRKTKRKNKRGKRRFPKVTYRKGLVNVYIAKLKDDRKIPISKLLARLPKAAIFKAASSLVKNPPKRKKRTTKRKPKRKTKGRKAKRRHYYN